MNQGDLGAKGEQLFQRYLPTGNFVWSITLGRDRSEGLIAHPIASTLPHIRWRGHEYDIPGPGTTEHSEREQEEFDALVKQLTEGGIFCLYLWVTSALLPEDVTTEIGLMPVPRDTDPQILGQLIGPAVFDKLQEPGLSNVDQNQIEVTHIAVPCRLVIEEVKVATGRVIAQG